MVVGIKSSLKENKIGYLKIKNYNFEEVEKFKYLGVMLNENNRGQTDSQERINNANKTFLSYKGFLRIKIYQRN